MEERHRDGYVMTGAPDRVDIDRVHRWLSKESYWAAGRSRTLVARSVEGSLPYSIFADGNQVGFARVVTDGATFGWICDVFVGQAWRGQGLGKALMTYLAAHPDLQGFRRMHLATRDAHGLYAQFGFGPLTGADRWMEIRNRDVYRR